MSNSLASVRTYLLHVPTRIGGIQITPSQKKPHESFRSEGHSLFGSSGRQSWCKSQSGGTRPGSFRLFLGHTWNRLGCTPAQRGSRSRPRWCRVAFRHGKKLSLWIAAFLTIDRELSSSRKHRQWKALQVGVQGWYSSATVPHIEKFG